MLVYVIVTKALLFILASGFQEYLLLTSISRVDNPMKYLYIETTAAGACILSETKKLTQWILL